MTKEIKKEKIEITLEIFNNIKAMIKSSNTEDFFIGIKVWFAMDPPDILTAILKKHAWKRRADDFDEYQRSEGYLSQHKLHRHALINKPSSWPAIMNIITVEKQYKPYRDIISQEFNAYINQKLINEGIGDNIKPIKTEIKWQN